MITRICASALLLMASSFLPAAEPPPWAEISNGAIHARLYLPDSNDGYYRGTRFDWSGQISSLKYKGHEYFGKWFDKYDPLINDAILGPVDEFLSGDSALGYSEAKTGDSFVRIGVGAVRKPEEKAFRRFHTYDITNPGKWTIKPRKDRVEFTHDLSDTNGYAYSYKKTVRLASGKKPRMVLEHTLVNKGSKPIETSVYNHNFYVIDGVPTGPAFSVKFPFAVKAARDFEGRAEIVGNELRYLQELEPGKSVFSELTGFSDAVSDYDFRVENLKSKAGVRQTGDRPIQKIVFWSIRTTVCPEAYVRLSIPPGQSATWKIVYDFYELP